MKISIIYYSQSGNTAAMAADIARGMAGVEGVEAQCFALDAVDAAFVQESCAVVFGTPTYYANTCWQIKQWFDESSISLAGKMGAAFATAGFLQGGAGTAINTLNDHLIAKGMLVYTGGCVSGSPMFHLGAIGLADELRDKADDFAAFGARFAQMAVQVFG